jgi:hypothetical protein
VFGWTLSRPATCGPLRCSHQRIDGNASKDKPDQKANDVLAISCDGHHRDHHQPASIEKEQAAPLRFQLGKRGRVRFQPACVFFVALPASWDLLFRAKHLRSGANRTATGHLNCGIDGVFEIVRCLMTPDAAGE